MGLVRAIDAATGQPIEVEEAQADSLLASGRIRADGPVRVVRSDGQVFEVDDAATALQATDPEGRPLFQLETEDRAAERAAQREFGDAPIRAGLAGAARGATLGLSDVAGEQLGFGDELAELQRRNEGASLGGEVVGSLLPFLVPGGQAATGARLAGEGASLARGGGVLTRMLRGASAPARAAEGLGLLAERGTAALLGEGATAGGRILRRTLATSAGGAAEGAAFGAGQVLSEEALSGGNYDALGERLVAGAGSAALFGAGAGGLLGGTGALLGEGTAAARRYGSELIERAFASTTGTTLRPGVAELYERGADLAAGAGALVTGRDRGFIRQALDLGPEGQRTRDIIRRGDDVLEEGTRRLVPELNAAEVAGRHARDFWGYGLKRQQVRGMVSADAIDGQIAAVQQAVAAARAATDDILANPGLYRSGTGAQARQLQRAIQAREAEIASAIARRLDSPTDAATDLFMQADAIKREIGRMQGSLERVGDPTALRRMRDVYEENFRPLLEQDELWGAAAATMQRDVNSAYTQFLSRRQRFAREFLGDTVRDNVDPFRALEQADSGRIRAFLGAAGTAANDTRRAVFREVLSSGDDLSQAMARHMDLPSNIASEIAQGATSTRRALATLDEVEDAAARLNQFRELERAGGIERAMLGAVAGTALGGVPGAAIAGALASPATTIRMLSSLERIARRTDDRVARSVKGFVDRALDTARESSRRTTGRARRAGVAASVQAYEERVAQLAENTDPRRAQERLASSTRALDTQAPQTRDALHGTALRGVAFLAARVPRGSSTVGLLPGMQTKPRVSEVERARFMRLARAVDDPLSVLDDLEHGMLSREAVEALREVYPHLHSQIVEQVAQVLIKRAEAGRPLPYRETLQLGLLLGVPTHPSLRPESLAMLQQTYAAPQSAAAQPPRAAAPGTASRHASSLQTESQRLEMRRAAT